MLKNYSYGDHRVRRVSVLVSCCAEWLERTREFTTISGGLCTILPAAYSSPTTRTTAGRQALDTSDPAKTPFRRLSGFLPVASAAWGRQNGWCVEFETSKITAFLGQEREASRYLDYLLLDVSTRKKANRSFLRDSSLLLPPFEKTEQAVNLSRGAEEVVLPACHSEWHASLLLSRSAYSIDG